jgi:16S rRNA G966 N2-methylase RsmD
MYRVCLFGKVGYFKELEEAMNFAWERFKPVEFDEFLKEIRASAEDIKSDFNNLRRFNTKRLNRRFIWKNNVGINVANYFMGFRLALFANGKPSPWLNMKQERPFRYSMKTHFIMQKTNNLKSINDIFDRARIRGGSQELNNFPPVVAKTLYETYCPVNGKILDFSAGFGGRLVGAMSSKNNYQYVGVDPSTKAVESLNKLRVFLNVEDRAKIINKPFEDCDGDLENDSFDYCFTSPPYFNKEIYSDEETQSCNRYNEIEAWRTGFLKKSFEIIQKKLKKGCLLMVNIADITNKGVEKYPLEKITVDTAKEVGFEYKGFRKMLIGNRFSSLKKARAQRKKFNYEPIFIFEKK